MTDAVVAELAWTPNVNATNIGVAVVDGVVTLSGEVLSYPEREQAERAALRVCGVPEIADEIDVHLRGDAPSDSDIARQAAEMLDRAVDVPEQAAQAPVHHQIATLSGDVSWQYQRAAAYRAVAYLKGVTAVVNDIRITPQPSVADIKSAITAALIRNVRVEARNIDVATRPDGTVTLTGTGNSWHERWQAEHAAWCAPGVAGVESLLRFRT